MRNDLLDAQASVDWAKAQIPTMEKRFEAWKQSRPYAVVVEPDLNTGDNLVVVCRTRLADLSFNVETGIIIHAIRSALDLLAASLARRNGVVPNRGTHFPTFRTIVGFNDPSRGIDGAKCKQWLAEPDRLAIKALRPYGGGDEFLYPFHHLDTIRKHERLVTIVPVIQSLVVSEWGERPALGKLVWEGAHDKTVLFRAPPQVRPRITESNPTLSYAISFSDPVDQTLAEKKPVFPTLRAYAARVAEIVRLFDDK